MTNERGPSKLSIVVFSGDFDKVHYALVLATGAAAVETPVTLFFTMEACRALLKPLANGLPGWRTMPTGRDGIDGGAMDDAFASRGVATFEELLSACPELNVRFLVCEMGPRAIGLSRADLREEIPIEEGGVVTFLADASADGAMVFI